MKTITSNDSIGSLIDNIDGNVCPNCGKSFVIVALMLRSQTQAGQFWYDVFNISEEVYCPDCSPREKEGHA